MIQDVARKRGRKKKTPAKLKGGLGSSSDRQSAPRMRRNPYAACVAQFGYDGRVYLYLNAGIPTGHHPSEGICPRCKHAYSHMIGSDRKQCRECDGDDLAVTAMQLEKAGINLGWGFSEVSDTRDHQRERNGYSSKNYRLQADAKEV